MHSPYTDLAAATVLAQYMGWSWTEWQRGYVDVLLWEAVLDQIELTVAGLGVCRTPIGTFYHFMLYTLDIRSELQKS